MNILKEIEEAQKENDIVFNKEGFKIEEYNDKTFYWTNGSVYLGDGKGKFVLIQVEKDQLAKA